MPKILKLTLKKQWFDAIKDGIKKEEYRIIKPWSISRLWNLHLETPRQYDIIEFKNGYSKNSHTLLIKYVDCLKNDSENIFIIKLGDIVKS